LKPTVSITIWALVLAKKFVRLHSIFLSDDDTVSITADFEEGICGDVVVHRGFAAFHEVCCVNLAARAKRFAITHRAIGHE
jgi:hypothetical protein